MSQSLFVFGVNLRPRAAAIAGGIFARLVGPCRCGQMAPHQGETLSTKMR
jgi:hypothetical protein